MITLDVVMTATGLATRWRRGLHPVMARAWSRLNRHVRRETARSVHLDPAESRPEVVLAPATHIYQRRQVLVASDLGTLRGPLSGEVRLPELLKWSGDENAAKFNLDDPEQRPALYVAVLREAHEASELGEWLNSELLVELWPQLVLPKPVRAAWEEQHPVLSDLGASRQLRRAS